MSGANSPALKRELGVFGAVMLGMGAIVGTGVFVSIGIGAGITGPSVTLAIAIAAFVATCNAFSSAQLAAAHPVAGGTYEYGYTYLNPKFGVTAGWMFLCAKSASAATAALGFSGYLRHTFGTDESLYIPIAVGTSVLMTLIVLAGLRRSNAVNTIIVSVTLLALGAFVVCGLPTALANTPENLQPFWSVDGETGPVRSFLYATALMFVAYTGYGRIATMGEEVHEPRRTIPRAIVVTLVGSSLLYMAVGFVMIGVTPRDSLAELGSAKIAPLESLAGTFDLPAVRWLVAIGAMTAMLGVLLNLILGLSRVLLAMGRRGDMPKATANLNAAGTTPMIAVIVIGVIVTGLACIGSVKATWSFSAFTVLVYYAITNLAALQLKPEDRIYPRWCSWAGMASCAFLACWVEWQTCLVGVGLIVVGLAWHKIAKSLRSDGDGVADS